MISNQPLLNSVSQRLLFLSPSVQSQIEQECCTKDFDILSALGQGAFGKVYRVRNQVTKVIYALKQISKKQIQSQQMVNQIANQVKIMYMIDHPNVIKLYNHFQQEQYIYLLLEYASGGQLWQKLNQVGRFDEQTVKQFMVDIFKAVEYLHNKKPPVIHRDIKPENLILDQYGHVKLADFGWSNVFNDKQRMTYCGTLDYLAPEMIQEIGHDEKLDIWSVGVLIYELMTGKAPFAPGENIKDPQEQQKILENNIVKVSIQYPTDFPQLAKDLVSRLLQKEPTQRLNMNQIREHPWFSLDPTIKEIFAPIQKEIMQDPLVNIQPSQKFTDKELVVLLKRENSIQNPEDKRHGNQGNGYEGGNQINNNNGNNNNYSTNQSMNQSNNNHQNNMNQSGLNPSLNSQNTKNLNQPAGDDQTLSNSSGGDSQIFMSNNGGQNMNDSTISIGFSKDGMDQSQVISGGGGEGATQMLDLNSKIAQLQKENSNLSMQLQRTQKQQQKMMEENQRLKGLGTPSDLSTAQQRRLKILEEEQNSIKREYDKLWETLQEKETEIQRLKFESEKFSDLKKDLEKAKTEKQTWHDKAKKIQEEYNALVIKYNELQTQEQLDLKSIQLNSSSSGSEYGQSTSIKDLAILIQEIKKQFSITQDSIESMDLLKEQKQKIERDYLILKMDRDNQINQAKIKLQEDFEEDMEKQKQELKREMQSLVQKHHKQMEELNQQLDLLKIQFNKKNQQESDYESLKQRLDLSQGIIKDLKSEWDENQKLQETLEGKLQERDTILKDKDQEIQRLKNSNSGSFQK